MLFKGMKEILWQEAFAAPWRGVSYSPTSVPRRKAEIIAQEELSLLQEIRQHVEDARSGQGKLFVKLTAGRHAGTIAEVTTIPDFDIGSLNPRMTPSNCVSFRDVPHYNSNGNGTFTFDGHLYSGSWSIGDQTAIASVDGKEILNWTLASASIKSARPALLLGYDGTTVFKRAGKGDVAEAAIKLADRYGQPVIKGDLVIIGNSKNGELYVGKLERYTDARTMFVKHIGASTSIKLPNVQDNQILKITDMDALKQLLMLEKLLAL